MNLLQRALIEKTGQEQGWKRLIESTEAAVTLDFTRHTEDIASRVLKLTYTTSDLKPWAEAPGYNGAPFAFDPDRRAQLRAELDAYYARLYGLTRDDLRYILDPADVMGPDYPSETFRVLKNNDIKTHGEYRTQRLVLEAWDAQETESNASTQGDA